MVTTVNKVTGEPLPGVTIFATEDLSWDPINNAKGTFFEGVTDQNGKLAINFKMRNNGKYQVIQSDAPNSCWHNTKAFFLEDKKNQNITFEFAPCAQLKLKIENVNCEGGGDEMVLYQGNQIGSIDFSQPWEHNGCALWESNGYSKIPMGEQYYRWEVTRSGTTDIFHDTIYLEEGEQRVYEILY